jgi:hypothetical protein
MTRTPFAGLAILFVVWFWTPAVVAQQKPHAAPNPDAVTQQDFKTRIDQYVELHNEAAKDISFKPTNNPAEIKAAQEALAERIRSARADARPGDIFSPEIRARFRELLAPTLKGEDGRDAKAVVKDDAPPAVPFKVNARYPEGAPLPTVPAKLLLNLPPLPKHVEYRIIDKHLILRDVDANIIVDYIPNAIR